MTTPPLSDHPGLGEHDLVVVTYACASNEGKPDAKAALGVSFGKGYSIFGGFNMGHEVPAEMAQRTDVAAYIAISSALSFAPASYNLYIATNCPSALTALNEALDQLKEEILSNSNDNTAAWPKSLAPEKTTDIPHASTMRTVLQGIKQREAQGNVVKIISMEHVDEPTHLRQASALAELSLKKAPGSAKAQDHSLTTQGSSAVEAAKADGEAGKKEGALATSTEGKAEEAEEEGAALSAKVDDEVGGAKEKEEVVAPKAGKNEAGEAKENE